MEKIENLLNALVELYGRVPSFHDATVLEIKILPNREVLIRFYIYEMPISSQYLQPWDQRDLHVVAWLKWKQVRECKLFLTDHTLYQISFDVNQDEVVCEFFLSWSEKRSRIVSQELQVVSTVLPKGLFLDENGTEIDDILVINCSW